MSDLFEPVRRARATIVNAKGLHARAAAFAGSRQVSPNPPSTSATTAASAASASAPRA